MAFFNSFAILRDRWWCLWIISLWLNSQLFKMWGSSSIEFPHLQCFTDKSGLPLALFTFVGREPDRAWMALIFSPTFNPVFVYIQSLVFQAEMGVRYHFSLEKSPPHWNFEKLCKCEKTNDKWVISSCERVFYAKF